MTFKKLKAWLFKPHHVSIKKLLIVFAFFILFINALHYVLEHTNSDLYDIKELSIKDIDFTDIVYQTTNSTDTNLNKILLINIGTTQTDSIRSKLTRIIPLLDSFGPKVIGVDVYFPPNPAVPDAINAQLDSLFRQKHLVIAADAENQFQFPPQEKNGINYGFINFPGFAKNTRRTYYNTDQKLSQLPGSLAIPTFASKLVSIYNPRIGLASSDSEFIIKYTGSEKGFYNVLNSDAVKDSVHDFGALELDYLLNSTQTNRELLAELIRGKIVIIGWLGSPVMDNEYDVTDKHRVPVNFQLFNRMPTMPGAVIQANAAHTLLTGVSIKELNVFWHYFILYGIAFLYLLLFMYLHKIRPILLQLVVEILILILSTLFLIYCSVWLMQRNIHIKIGEILFYIVVLIEYKIFAFELYEYIHKKKAKRDLKNMFTKIKKLFVKKKRAQPKKAIIQNESV